ncbi:biopolymer transporter ExbD [Zhongshania aquimaris]|uniref:Biopolymer transporter ExbD n=1 Tax=Zhongshania aquimaris TaxID=2857107 RepID=A0ABS6VVI4_9GAMM|nr:biopolymer transporter ExbD [Zhongshania aquimaris]MBW2942301.1 biopolymer transporter ExbD [Zhongshania aquimaris]|tara:strand:- start:649 stop:1164 length:516 start_codon:yes stop_codon:yes gene_type:complete
MNYTASDRRVIRKLKQTKRQVSINVVSLIDIFAILVFYLLVNALVVEVIPEYQNLKLPDSLSKDQAKRTVAVAISDKDILVDNDVVMSIEAALAENAGTLDLLAEMLGTRAQDSEDNALDPQGQPSILDVNIVADHKTPYLLLKKVLATCVGAQFGKVSLAVRELERGSTK